MTTDTQAPGYTLDDLVRERVAALPRRHPAASSENDPIWLALHEELQREVASCEGPADYLAYLLSEHIRMAFIALEDLGLTVDREEDCLAVMARHGYRRA